MADTTTRGRAPDSPTDLSRGTWKDTFKRTLREFKEDDLTLLAAALTYYGVLSLFPALSEILRGCSPLDPDERTSFHAAR